MFRTSVPYAVIGVVAKEKELSVQALHQQICTKGISVSLPNFYKIIAHMIDDQILIRPKGRIQLHALFLRYLFGISETTQQVYVADETNVLQRLAVGQQEAWEESTLYDLNVIRLDLLGQLVKAHAGTKAYHYSSHPYFLLSTPEKEQTSMEELASGMEKSYYLLGNNTFLDRYGSQLLNQELYTVACSEDTPFPEEGYSVDIIGDYIVECMFPKALTEHFTLFFQTILGLEGYKKDMFCQVLKMKAGCSIKLIYSPEHAKKMKLKIEKQFSAKS